MKGASAIYGSLCDDWRTPASLYAKLDDEFRFDDDACPPGGRLGLIRSWGKRVFVNPPYSSGITEWIKKALKEIASGRSEVVVMLLASRTDTKWFHELVLPNAREIRFIKSRVRFGDGKGRAPFPSMAVVLARSASDKEKR